MSPEREELLLRRLDREKAARREAELILEQKSLELHSKNEELRNLNRELENRVEARTRELEQQKQAFQQLVESAGDMIYELDSEGRFRYLNPATEKLLGIRPELWIGRRFDELIGPDDRDRVLEEVDRWLHESREEAYLEFNVLDEGLNRRRLAQQVRIEYLDGRVSKATAVARDITELYRAQKSLRQSEEKYRGIIENMELGLLEVDASGKIAKAYEGFCSMTGYEREELIGRDPIAMFLHPSDVDTMHRQDADRRKGMAAVYEVRIKHKNGHWLWVLISGAPIPDARGNPNGSIGIHYDISPRKLLERELLRAKDEAEKARQAEKEFLAHMSHEIRTPLNAVIGMANLLSTTALASEQKAFVDDILNAAELLHSLISDVLDISKIEAGQVDVTPEVFDLRQTLEILCRTLDYHAREKGNKLSFELSDRVPSAISADRTLLSQVLYNLIGNAIKFTQNGSIEIRVFEPVVKSQGLLMLPFSVSDTGIGIEPGRIDRVFDRFTQAEDEHQARAYGGTGLGLAIAKNLIELQGGSISVESEPQKGSSFFFEIAISPAPDEAQRATLKTGRVDQLRGLRVLLAEDSYMNRKYVKGLMDQWGVELTEVSDGLEAVQTTMKARFDLILMDVQMPIKDGYEAVRLIRSRRDNPNLESPIIALTASALIDDRRKALEAGMNAHITKPFRPDLLLERMLEVLELDLEDGEEGRADSRVWAALSLPEIFDRKGLEHLYGSDLQYALHMLRIFSSRFDPELEEAQSARSERPRFRAWLHRISPSLAMVGLSDLSRRAANIEKMSEEAGVQEAELTEIARFLEEFEGSRPFLVLLEEQLQQRIPS